MVCIRIDLERTNKTIVLIEEENTQRDRERERKKKENQATSSRM
jgi:predicted NBD/HSP70 family sugar kinase